jgi:hypothetical protein
VPPKDIFAVLVTKFEECICIKSLKIFIFENDMFSDALFDLCTIGSVCVCLNCFVNSLLSV